MPEQNAAPPTISEAVAEKIASAGPEIRKRVIDHLAEEKVAKLSNLVMKGYAALDDLEIQLRKLKPDNKTYAPDGSGALLQEGFSHGRMEERKKLQKRITKLTSALNQMLEHNNSKSLEEYFRGGDKPDKPADES